MKDKDVTEHRSEVVLVQHTLAKVWGNSGFAVSAAALQPSGCWYLESAMAPVTGEDITSVAVVHLTTKAKRSSSEAARCATQAGPLIAGSSWTPRRTFGLIKPSASHIPACVPQQPLAPPRLQTAALPEGQDFCLCRKKQIFTPNPHTSVRLQNQGQ